MMEWTDCSDGSTRFFNAESEAEVVEESLTFLLRSMIDFCSTRIVGKGNATRFDTVFFEAGCDSGRLIIAIGTLESRESGKLDGCSVYVKKLQDYWYDLRAQNLSGSDFCSAVEKVEVQLAESFGHALADRIRAGGFQFSTSRLRLIAYGSEPGEVLLEKSYTDVGTEA